MESKQSKTALFIKEISFSSILWMLLTTIAVSIPNISPWIATPLVLIGLIFVLGFLLAINLKLESDKISEYFLYSTGLGLAFLIVGGLFINWAFPYLGISQPLARLPLMIFFDISTIILSIRAYLFNKDYSLPNISWPSNKTGVFLGIFPWLFVILSVCGAEILNNGGSGVLTLIMLFGIAVYVLVLMACHKKIDGWTYISALYSIGLSLLLMYSLRSSHILGWDINQEFQVFQMTLQNLRWKMSYYPGLDYNACMSITILPTILKELTNMPSEYIYKVTFQLLFAGLPVMVYAFARRYLNGALAFLASFLLISQTWFFEQMPGLVRQEIAFIFYAVVVLVLFDSQLSKRMRYTLFYIFTVAIILSHYSTAYVWLALMFGVIIFSYVAQYCIKSLRGQPIIIKPLMFVISFIILFIWQVPLTHTTGNAQKFATNTNPAVVVSTPTITSSSTSSSNGGSPSVLSLNNTVSVVKNAALTSLFASPTQNTDQNILLAENQAVYIYKAYPGYVPYPDAITSGYVPTTIIDGSQVPQKLPQAASSILNLLARASKIIFVDIFPLIGIAGIYLSLRDRRSFDGAYSLVVLNIVGLGFLMLMILIPYVQVYYGFTRLYLQVFITLGTLAVIGGVMATKYFPRYQMATLAVLAVLLFCSLNGSFDQLTGGAARITLDQPPSTFDSDYIYDTEIASAQWLAENRAPMDPIQSDDVAYLRLQSFANISLGSSAIFPQTIEQNSYVYLTQMNALQGMGFILYNGNLLTYNYPLTFLNNNKNLIYNDGGSRIYK